MVGFNVAPSLSGFDTPYPNATMIAKACTQGGERTRHAIARQWLSEGLPFAFKSNPGLYDAVRVWISSQLDVEAKSISLYGSARLGQSLAPHQVGKPFNEESDLDLFVISDDLFARIKGDFIKWGADYDAGKVIAKNDRQKRLWHDTRIRMEKYLFKGFLDPHLVPSYKTYETVSAINETMYLLKRKLTETKAAPIIKRATLRCYKSWPDFVRQCSINLASLK